MDRTVEGVRADRLLTLLLHLDRRRKATASELAEVLEVSVRTVYRDVAALQAAGVPLWTQPGPRGGVRLLDGWRSPIEGLTADEAGVLFLAGAPAAAGELGLSTLLAGAQTKVLSTLPPELRARAGRVRERFHLDAPGWFRRTRDDLDHLPVLADAVWTERRVHISYGRGGEQVERRLDPLGLVLKAGTWYVVARQGDRVLTYRISRITRAEVLDERFDRPEGFDLAAWWEANRAEFDRAILRAEVRLRLSPGARRRLPEAVGLAAASFAEDLGEPDEDGWQEVVVPVESTEVAAHQLVALAPDVEALDPSELRAALAAAGTRLARLNGSG